MNGWMGEWMDGWMRKEHGTLPSKKLESKSEYKKLKSKLNLLFVIT